MGFDVPSSWTTMLMVEVWALAFGAFRESPNRNRPASSTRAIMGRTRATTLRPSDRNLGSLMFLL
jgi:hypothetical protein